MSEVQELAEARRQERSAYDLMRSLTARIHLANQQAHRLEHDERIQLVYQVRSLGIARDRARADWLGWQRIVRQLAPTTRHRGSVSLALLFMSVTNTSSTILL